MVFKHFSTLFLALGTSPKNSYPEKELRFFQDLRRATKDFERHETDFRSIRKTDFGWIRKTDSIRIRDRRSCRRKMIASFLSQNWSEAQPENVIGYYCTNDSLDLRSIQWSLKNGKIHFPFITDYFPYALCNSVTYNKCHQVLSISY